MKLFGEYLVEKELIKPEELLFGLILQLKNTPPLAEILMENKLLSEDQILQILKVQAMEGGDFKSSATKLHLWKSEFDQKLKLLLYEKRPTIGQILYNQGYIQLVDLTKALDEFVSTYSKKESVADTPSSEPINPEYLHQFSGEKLQLILSGLEKADYSQINSIVREFHILKGSARFCGAKMSELLLAQSALILEILTLSENQFRSHGPQFMPLILKSVQYLDQIRLSISQSQNEFSGEQSSSFQAQVQEHYNQLKELVSELQNQQGAVA